LVKVPRARVELWSGSAPNPGRITIFPSGPRLTARDREPKKITARAGAAQLAYVNDAYRLVKEQGGALVTAAVSKAAIAHSGEPGADAFRGHTEWLQALDGAPSTTMCFHSPKLSTSLVTTHIPVSRVPASLTPDGVARSVVHLSQMLIAAGVEKPRVVVASLNPHAGEDGLLGGEEQSTIVPGIKAARARLRARAQISGPLGAETAYRHAASGRYDGVVAMYHDQATIPLKLIAFGSAVNVTMGLSVIRTSVDHGTAYDIAWSGKADATGMVCAIRFAARMAKLPV
jgi:4-hydroxythreonine-4-phosphate dehydrogenase